jgi:uncharacterized membrane-anchored protein
MTFVTQFVVNMLGNPPTTRPEEFQYVISSIVLVMLLWSFITIIKAVVKGCFPK